MGLLIAGPWPAPSSFNSPVEEILYDLSAALQSDDKSGIMDAILLKARPQPRRQIWLVFS
jgi:hypothetical protein